MRGAIIKFCRKLLAICEKMDLKDKKFVASLSGGKDSAQAVYKALCMGMKPVFYFTTYDRAKDRNYFHGMSREMVEKLSDSYGVKIHLVETDPKGYAADFESMLRLAKSEGAEFCLFGDIDIEEHRTWGEDRCKNAGLTALYPLWQMARRQVVEDFIDSGFKSVITVVDTSHLGEEFLGEVMSHEVMERIKNAGCDECGERGEYHTFVFSAPTFKYDLKYRLSDIKRQEQYAYKIMEFVE